MVVASALLWITVEGWQHCFSISPVPRTAEDGEMRHWQRDGCSSDKRLCQAGSLGLLEHNV